MRAGSPRTRCPRQRVVAPPRVGRDSAQAPSPLEPPGAHGGQLDDPDGPDPQPDRRRPRDAADLHGRGYGSRRRWRQTRVGWSTRGRRPALEFSSIRPGADPLQEKFWSGRLAQRRIWLACATACLTGSGRPQRSPASAGRRQEDLKSGLVAHGARRTSEALRRRRLGVPERVYESFEGGSAADDRGVTRRVRRAHAADAESRRAAWRIAVTAYVGAAFGRRG